MSQTLSEAQSQSACEFSRDAAIGRLRAACNKVLDALAASSASAAAGLRTRHAEETGRLGDPSVLDLFHYHNHAAAPGTQNMSSHSDPGTSTPHQLLFASAT